MSWLSSGLKKLGHIAAPIVHLGAEAAGGVGGFLTGGPAGAYAGYKLGDKLGNIGQDALSGANVRKHLGDNLLGAGEAAAGGYLAAGAPGLGNATAQIPGATSVASILGHGGETAGGAIPDAAMGIPSSASNGGWLNTAEGVAGKAGSFLTGNGGKNALALAQGVNAILDQKKAENY